MSKDDIGDRLKGYELSETGRRFMPLLPVYARIDGRSFSKFTRDFARPYDKRLSDLMINVTKHLVDKTDARMGYTQSDEISLCWHQDSFKSEMFFAGRIQKMCSVLAGMASSHFMRLLARSEDEFLMNKIDEDPSFDCRVFQLPNQTEVANTFLWREMDATKNAVSMAARSMFSHNRLQGKKGSEMQEMMFQEHGVNFSDYPSFFKRGTFVRRETVLKELGTDELARIPEHARPVPGTKFKRHELTSLDMPKFSTVINRVDVVFNGAKPLTVEDVIE